MTVQHPNNNFRMLFVRYVGLLYAQDESLPLLSVIDAIFSKYDELRVATRFIILIAGSTALVGR